MQESYLEVWTFQVVQVVKNLHANTGDVRDAGLIPGLERSCEVGNGKPFQCSCWDHPMDRGAWWATIYGHNQATKHTCTSHGTERSSPSISTPSEHQANTDIHSKEFFASGDGS